MPPAIDAGGGVALQAHPGQAGEGTKKNHRTGGDRYLTGDVHEEIDQIVQTAMFETDDRQTPVFRRWQNSRKILISQNNDTTTTLFICLKHRVAGGTDGTFPGNRIQTHRTDRQRTDILFVDGP